MVYSLWRVWIEGMSMPFLFVKRHIIWVQSMAQGANEMYLVFLLVAFLVVK